MRKHQLLHVVALPRMLRFVARQVKRQKTTAVLAARSRPMVPLAATSEAKKKRNRFALFFLRVPKRQ